MNRGCRYYEVKNIKTGEEFHGKTTLIKKKTGIDSRDLYMAAYRGSIIADTWKVEFSDGESCASGENSLTEEDLQKWDNAMKILHKKSRGRIRKPQEVR